MTPSSHVRPHSRPLQFLFGVVLAVGLGLALASAVRGTVAGAPLGPQAPDEVAGIFGAGASGLILTNLDESAPADIVATFYGLDGAAPIEIERKGVGPLQSQMLFLPLEGELPRGAFAVRIDGEGPIGVVERTEWFSSGGVTKSVSPDIGEELYLLDVAKDYYGRDSIISVQNLDPDHAADLDLELFAPSASTPQAALDVTIAPGSSISVDLALFGELQDLPDGFNGWARLRADREIAAYAFHDLRASRLAVGDTTAFAKESAAARLYAPYVASQAGEALRSSQITVLHTGTDATSLSITYRGAGGSCAGQTYEQGPIAIPAGAMLTIPQRDIELPGLGRSGLPAGCVASAELVADAPLLADVAIESATGSGRLAGYGTRGVDAAADLAVLPLVRNQQPTDWAISSVVHAQNASPKNAEVRLELFDWDGAALGCATPCVRELAPGEAARWDLSEGGVLPPNRYGSARLVSTQPLLAAVLESSPNESWDDSIHLGHGVLADAPRRAAVPLALTDTLVRPTPPPGSTREPAPTPQPVPTSEPEPTADPAEPHTAFDERGRSGVILVSAQEEGALDATLRLWRLDGPDEPADLAYPSIEPGGSRLVYLPVESELDDGLYSARVDATGDIGVIARSDWIEDAPGAATVQEAAVPALRLVLPQVFRSAWGSSSAVVLRNDGDQPAAAHLQLMPYGSTIPLRTLELDLPPDGASVLRLDGHPDLADLPEPFAGWLRVVSDMPLSAESLQHLGPGTGIYGLSGLPEQDGTETLWAPSLYRAHALKDASGPGPLLDSRLELLNPTDEELSVEVAYRGQAGADLDAACAELDLRTDSIPLAPGEHRVLHPGDPVAQGGAGLSVDCRLSASVEPEGARPIAWVVTTAEEGARSMAYPLRPAAEASTRHVLPYVRRNQTSERLQTAIQVLNPGTTAAEVQVRFADEDGAEIPCAQGCALSVPPGRADLYWPPAIDGLDALGWGMAWVQSDQPIEVRVEDLAMASARDLAGYASVRPGAAGPRALPLVFNGARLQSAGVSPAPLPAPFLGLPEEMPELSDEALVVPLRFESRGHDIQRASLRLHYDADWLRLGETDADGDGLPDAIRLLQSGAFELRVTGRWEEGGEIALDIRPREGTTSSLEDGTLLELALDAAAPPTREAGWLRFSEAQPPALWDRADEPWLADLGGGWFRILGRVHLPFVSRDR